MLQLGRLAVGSAWLCLRFADGGMQDVAEGATLDELAHMQDALAFPLRAPSAPTPYGTLWVGPRVDGTPLEPDRQSAAKLLAQQIAQQIERAALWADQIAEESHRMVDALTDALLVTDQAGHFYHANAAFQRLLERHALPPVGRAQRGQPLAALCPQELADLVEALQQQLVERGTPDPLRWSPTLGQEQYHFRVVAAPMAATDSAAARGMIVTFRDISERYRMRVALNEHNQALEHHRNELMAILDATENGVLLSDREGIIRHANRALHQILHRSSGTLLERPVREVMAEVASRFDDAPNFLRRARWLYDHPRIVARDAVKTTDARPLFFERYSAPVYAALDSREPCGRVEVFTNLTRSRRLEETLRERNERIQQHLKRHRALYDVGTRAISELELPRALDVLTSTLMGLFSADGVAVLMPNGSGMKVMNGTGLSQRYLAQEQGHYDASAASEAVRRHEPLLVADAWSDPRHQPLHQAVRDEGVRTILYLPLIFREEEVGLLGIYHRAPYRYATEEMELLAIFGSQATSILKNTQLYNSVATSQQQLRTIINSMLDGVVALDEWGRVAFVNRALYRMLGLPRDQSLVGCPASELNGHLGKIVARVQAGIRHPAAIVELEHEISAPARVFQVIGAPTVGEGSGRVILLHDITERRASELMKEGLIATISHELRTPLTSILGYSSLLARQQAIHPARRQRWAETLLEKSKQLKQQVDEIFDLSALLRREVPLVLEELDLVRLIESVADYHRRDQFQHEICLDLLPLPPLLADGRRLRRALDVLLSNAITYSPDGGDVRVTLRGEASWVIVTVSDDGIGIAPEHLEHIFDPFYRVDNSSERLVYGTGLGLSLVQAIVRAHGGEIIVKSRLGQGTTFVVSLPRRTPIP